MKVLIMVHSLTGGGAERVAALWTKGFVKRGHEVGVVLNCKKNTPVTYAIPPVVKLYNVCGNPIVNWVANKLHRKLQMDTYYIRELHNVLQDFLPDMAIGVLHPWAEWTRKASRGMNIVIVNTEHFSFEWPDDSERSQLMRRQKYEWNRNYDHVTVLTEADKRCVQGLLSNVTVLPNPLAYNPVDREPHKENVILAAGRLKAWRVKGFDVLIKAWGKIAVKYPDWKLQIAGQGSVKALQYLQTLADEAHIGQQLEFIGYQSNMLPIYQRSSIFVLSSRYEGFGMVLIEAMSQGCACIACDYKGRQREIITSDDEGKICPVDDADALSDAIQLMIADESYRKKVQKQAIERSKYYCLDNIMNKWEHIIAEVKLKDK